MTAEKQSWMTIHRVRLSRFLSADEVPLAQTNLWGGFAIYSSKRDAEEVLKAPTTHIPLVAGAVESSHALASPYVHHGVVNRRHQLEVATVLNVGSDPGGPLAVFTSVGFDSATPEDLPRVLDFIRRVYSVRDQFNADPGNIRQCFFTASDECDGTTFSIWRSDAAMQRWRAPLTEPVSISVNWRVIVENRCSIERRLRESGLYQAGERGTAIIQLTNYRTMRNAKQQSTR